MRPPLPQLVRRAAVSARPSPLWLVSIALLVTVTGCGGRHAPLLRGVLHRVADVRLPSGEGRSRSQPNRLDEVEADPDGGRLYVAHQGADEVDVVDLRERKVVGVVQGISHVHAVRLAPDLGKLFATASTDDQVLVVDVRDLRVIAGIPTGRFPDSVAYDPVHHLVAVSDRDDGSETVFAAGTGAVLRTVHLGQGVGNVTYDPTTARVLVAVDAPDEFAGVDLSTGAVERQTLLPGCDGPHGVAVDPTAGVAFVGCRANDRLSVVDLHQWRQQSLEKLDGTPDDVVFDPGLHRLYVAADSGVATVFDVDHGRLRRRGQGRVERHAHSIAVDAHTHQVFFPVESAGGHPIVRIMKPSKGW